MSDKIIEQIDKFENKVNNLPEEIKENVEMLNSLVKSVDKYKILREDLLIIYNKYNETKEVLNELADNEDYSDTKLSIYAKMIQADTEHLVLKASQFLEHGIRNRIEFLEIVTEELRLKEGSVKLKDMIQQTSNIGEDIDNEEDEEKEEDDNLFKLGDDFVESLKQSSEGK